MKITFAIILSVLLGLVCLPLAHAQPGTVVPPEIAKTTFARVLDFLATNPTLAKDTNWTVIGYASHARGLLDEQGNKSEWGGGIAALYPLNDYVRTGVRLQYFAGDFYMPSVNLQLQSSYKPFGLPLVFTPVAFTGLATPINGSQDNGTIGSLFGIGASLKYPLTQHREIGAGYAIEK